MTDAHEVIAAYWAAAEARDWAAFGALLADDVIYRGPQTREQVRGREAYIRFNVEGFTYDWHITVQRIVGEGQHAASWIEFTGPEGSQPGVCFFDLGDQGRERPDLDKQVPLPGDTGGEPPRPVAARQPGLIGRSEGEPGSARRVRPVGRAGFAPFSAAGRFGPGAAVADGVSLAVGDGEAPGGPGVAGGGRGEVAGQVGVDGANPSNFVRSATSGSAE